MTTFGIIIWMVVGLVALSFITFRLYRKNLALKNSLKEARDDLVEVSKRDPLTGLYTRNYLMEQLQRRLVEASKGFVAFYNISIENIKLINDAYGHDVGDAVLCRLSQRLQAFFPELVDCVGIDQSDFFIIDGKATSENDIQTRVLSLTMILNKPIVVDRMEIRSRVAVGIAHGPKHAIDSQLLLKQVCAAKNEASKLGPNQYYIFKQRLHKNSIQRMIMEKQIHRALLRKEFEMYYQPRIDIRQDKVVGCEALIRWNHPEGRVVYPNDFIPLAESVGLINDITQWVTKAVMTQVVTWESMGYPVKVSFNISGKEFDDAFITMLSKGIEEMAVNPGLLEVEITETAALKDLEHSKMLVDTLNDLGVTVALDDFGTGYSSMTYIKKLRAGKLKIDKSFIDDIEEHEQRVVVDSMIQLGQKLNYSINVEGVERQDQLEILKKLNVDEVQGWYFSKAVKAPEFIDYMKRFGLQTETNAYGVKRDKI